MGNGKQMKEMSKYNLMFVGICQDVSECVGIRLDQMGKSWDVTEPQDAASLCLYGCIECTL
jgi:hypothetical protein